ncbi:unnamed protein product, partial [Heterosigma akashiwo]
KEKREADELREAFFADRWRCSKKILDGEVKVSGASFDKKTCEDHFAKQYSDAQRDHVYAAPPPGLPRPPPPAVLFDNEPPSYTVFCAIVKKKRNASAPGINAISYKVYKFCSGVRRVLWRLLCFLWRKGLCPAEFCVGFMTLIEKKEGVTDDPALMRSICVLNSEGRIFFSCVAANVTSYMLKNGYIDVSQQKGALPGVSGCMDHASKMLMGMKDAKEGGRSMCVSFLDLAGSYPSVAHGLVQFALRWYHFPTWLCDLFYSYYERICARVVTDKWETDLIRFLIGVFQGCTALVIIFLIVFQVLLDFHSHHAAALIYHFKQDPELRLRNPAFVDDVALITRTAVENQQSINIFVLVLKWTRTMRLKAIKCRSWAIGFIGRDGRFPSYKNGTFTVYNPGLEVEGMSIMCIADDVEYLGSGTIFEMLGNKLKGWLAKVDECSLPGAFKVWIVNYVVYSRLVWHLVVYDIPDTVIRDWRHQCVQMYKKWLGVTRIAESLVFFRSRKEHAGLGLKDLETERDCMRLVVQCHILLGSDDEQMRLLFALKLRRERAGQIGRGKRASSSSPCSTLDGLLGRVAHLRMSQGQVGRQGVGFRAGPRKLWRMGGKQAERRGASLLTREDHEHRRLIRLYGLSSQGRWMKWGLLEELRGEQLSAEKMLFQYNRRLFLAFTINSILDTLPTPEMPVLWGKQGDDPSVNCTLCGAPAVRLSHILAGCPYVLKVENAAFKAGGHEDRYTNRHNNVLSVLANAIFSKLLQHKRSPPAPPRRARSAPAAVNFVRPGERAEGSGGVQQQSDRGNSFLEGGRDWVAAFDLPELRDLCARHSPLDAGGDTSKEINGRIFYSRDARSIVLLGPEMTCPMEENVHKWRVDKFVKYERAMLSHVPAQWWRKLITIKVGCRGYIADSFRTSLRSIGFISKEIKHLFGKCSYVARLSSLAVWRNRHNKSY